MKERSSKSFQSLWRIISHEKTNSEKNEEARLCKIETVMLLFMDIKAITNWNNREQFVRNNYKSNFEVSQKFNKLINIIKMMIANFQREDVFEKERKNIENMLCRKIRKKKALKVASIIMADNLQRKK